MWLLFLIVIFGVTVIAENNGYFDIKVGRTGTDIFESFAKFKNDMKQFFHINLNKIEKTRQRIKNAFYKFIEEVINDIDKSKDTKPLAKAMKKEREIKIATFEEMLIRDGYKAEFHTVVTPDGYVLTLHRILLANASIGKNGVVLLHHGLLGSSDNWILLGPKKALPYLLLNAEYDVWLPNARGNKYSKTHISKTLRNEDFWNFSWHEIGIFDLASVIDYVRERNDKDVQLNFIGHSMGATVLLVLLSVFPQYNHVFKTAILLAPLAFMYEVKGPLRLISDFYNKFNLESLNFLGLHEFTPLQKFSSILIDKFCLGNKRNCHNPLLLLTNGAQDTNKNLSSLIRNHTPGGGSMKTLIHYIQLVKSGQFQMFDLGRKKNLKKYGLPSPPIYRLNDVTLPITVFSSPDDWLSTNPDIKSLLSNLPNSVTHRIIRSSEFSHSDFVWAEDAHILVYYIILDVLKL